MPTEDYIRYSEPGEPQAPVVLALHGTGGDEHQLSGRIREVLPRVGLVALRGDVSEEGALRFFRRSGEDIYDMADLAIRRQKMARFVARLREGLPGRSLFGLGYSNGANILSAVLFAAPRLFDRVVLMHPVVPYEPTPNPALEGLPVLITGGRHDPICPLSLTLKLEDFLRGQGAKVELALHEGGHEVPEAEMARVAEFLGLS
ncbi:alpha/beta hydrolase [Rhodobacter sp. CZR27]|uniref:alpha/beta hydrolase n=1 Tax=Rhodobacter sp. CZR27 TaxID=2033869 RepID=UPI000BBF2645|nr:alpha/beta hydrolase [Rhodobacter sp. CZR27]